jgi:hypothetical protein
MFPGGLDDVRIPFADQLAMRMAVKAFRRTPR